MLAKTSNYGAVFGFHAQLKAERFRYTPKDKQTRRCEPWVMFAREHIKRITGKTFPLVTMNTNAKIASGVAGMAIG